MLRKHIKKTVREVVVVVDEEEEVVVGEEEEEVCSLKYFLFSVLGVMVFYATFNNISVISWGQVLLLGETRENHGSAAIT